MSETRTELYQWQALNLRLTVFPSPNYTPNYEKWWDMLVGEPPETINNQPRTGETIIDGPYGVGRLVLIVHPSRIDWRYGLSPEQAANIQNFDYIPNLGPYIETLPMFKAPLVRWIESEVDLAATRIAFGSELIFPTKTLSEANSKMLSKIAALTLDTADVSDLLFQINRRRLAKTFSNLFINRLTKWNTIRMLEGLFELNSLTSRKLPEKYGSHIELDINTFQEFQGEFYSTDIQAVFHELVELAIEIIEKGDTP